VEKRKDLIPGESGRGARGAPRTFWLGTHKPGWLASAGVPLFVSRRTLAPMRTLPRAIAPWALDSGGFTELAMHGAWLTTPAQYVAEVRRLSSEIGRMAWAAPQDWMCEPAMLEKTGLTVSEHQRRSVANLLELRSRAPDLPWVPVLQGWSLGDYWRHADAYQAAGVDLEAEPLVGVGSVCRRQSGTRAGAIFRTLAASGLSLHGFGVKVSGLAAHSAWLASADSMAWSMNARKHPPIDGHTHKNCANCIVWATSWRAELLERIGAGWSCKEAA
jgi:hypothetical protein